MPKSPEPETRDPQDEARDFATKLARDRILGPNSNFSPKPLIRNRFGIRFRHNAAHGKDQSLALRKELNGKGEEVKGDLEEQIHDTIWGKTR